MNRANILLTNKCNLRCKHCYLSAGKSHENSKSIYENTKLLIDKLVSDNFDNIMFTGGECMLFPYLKELIKYSKDQCLYTSIFTNGMIFDKEIFDMVDSVYLSLDGPKEIHNFIRQNNQSYDNIIKCLDYLRKIDKYTVIQMTISSLNKNCILDIKDLLLKYLNIRTMKIEFILDEGRANKNNLTYDKKDVINVLKDIDQLYDLTKYHIQFVSNYINEYDFNQYYLTGSIKFPVWFDMIHNTFYLFYGDKKFSTKLSQYNKKLIEKYNQKIIEEMQGFKKKFKQKKYINLEEIIKGMGDIND